MAELNEEDWSYPDLAGRELSRRTLINTLAALGVSGALGAHLSLTALSASATQYVEYRYPFPKGDIYGFFVAVDHGALDWGAGVGRGDSIPAIANGVVTRNTYGDLGWSVEIAHADLKFSGYCHMMEASPLAVGDAVVRGQTVGKVGNSGGDYANHLHMALATKEGYSIKGEPYSYCIDPIPWIDAHLAPGGSDTMFIKNDGTWYIVDEFTVWSTTTQSVASTYKDAYGPSTPASNALKDLLVNNAQDNRTNLINSIAAAVAAQLNP